MSELEIQKTIMVLLETSILEHEIALKEHQKVELVQKLFKQRVFEQKEALDYTYKKYNQLKKQENDHTR